MSRVVRSPFLVVLFVLLLIAGPFVYSACMRTHESLAAAPSLLTASQQPPPPSATDVGDGMLLAGFDSKALTAVGMTTQQVATFVTEFRDELAVQAAALDAAETAAAAAQVSSDALRRKIQSGKGSQEDVTSYQTQLAALASAKSSRETAMAACRAPAEALLNETQRAQLARIRTNKIWELPMEFLLVDRTQAEWVALRDALANEKIAPRYGEETTPAQATVLSTARANNDVATAKTRLDTNLTMITAALHAAIVE